MELASRLNRLGTESAFAVSAQAAAWAAQGNTVYPFHLGDVNLPTPENIIEAANRAIRDGKTGYAPAEGIGPLREVLAQDVSSRRRVSYGPENVSIQPGGKPVIGKFIAAVMNPGDEVLYPNPGYPIYESQIEFQGGIAVPYGYVETKDGFAIDLERLKAALSPRTRILIYNNYQNPIGAESSPGEMESLAQLAREHDLWVLSDEAYYEIRYGGEACSIVAFPGLKERTVILHTFSKKFAMTGWRMGAAIGPEKVIKVISQLNVNAESCSNHFIQWAMVEALSGDQSGPEEILRRLNKRRDRAVELLNAIDGIQIAAPNSTFYLFPNVTRIMESKRFSAVEQLQEETLVKSGVSFCTRVHFGRPLPGEKDFYVRLAYAGIDTNTLTEGLEKLKGYLES